MEYQSLTRVADVTSGRWLRSSACHRLDVLTLYSRQTGVPSFRRQHMKRPSVPHHSCSQSRSSDSVSRLSSSLVPSRTSWYNLLIIASDKRGGKCVRSRLSVSLLAILLKNVCMDLNEMLRVDRCRDMDELINFWARSVLQTRCRNRIAFYRISAGTRNFTSGKSDVYVLAAAATRGFTMVLFTEPWAVETPLSKVHKLYRVPF